MELSQDLWPVSLTIVDWTIRIGAVLIVPFRRSADAAKAWLLALFVFPIPAAILYAVIGRARHPRWRRARVKRLPEILDAALADARTDPAAHVVRPPEDCRHLARLAKAMSQMPAVGGNMVDLQADYDRAIRRLVDDIDAARAHVHLMFYIFADDSAGDLIMSALERAVARGVTCRLMIDALGSMSWSGAVRRRMEAAGVDFDLMLPLGIVGRVSRADMRNHRKVAVIDGRIGWTGSQNIVACVGGDGMPNRELLVRLTGPAVAQLQLVFIGDWFLETDDRLTGPDLFPQPDIAEPGSAAQIVASGPDYPHARIDMLFTTMLHAARERAVLATPYFIPSDALVMALRTAAQRGVTVDLFLSARTDSRTVDFAQQSYFADLMAAGVGIHLYEGEFLHAKHVSIDDRIALIGSSNIDMRSFELNSEVALISYSPDIVSALRDIEDDYRRRSRTCDLGAWRQRGLYRKTLENIARMAGPLL
ncbi:MAG: cardiolipin synthase [Pseudomonadota bacterium]